MRQPYRLGIDIGTNSLGWCLLLLDDDNEPCGILDIGVRIFKDARDPKSRASLAATRRSARTMRRQRDRRLGRKHRLVDALVKHGLMPTDASDRRKLEKLDPYRLRAEGLERRLEPSEFGRALFHIGQRRGFQSNLKTDRAERKGVTKEAQRKLAEALGDHRTLGEFLFRRGVSVAERTLDGKSLGCQRRVRFRPHAKGAKVEYDLYPTRAMYRAEFDALWVEQRRFGLALDDAARSELAHIIFDQRELKPVPVGKCTFEPGDPRAPEALPISQRFRMLQEVNNLEWIDRDRRSHRLDSDQRAKILRLLERKKKVPFDRMRTLLDLGDAQFNLESDKRKWLDGDKIAHEMAHKSRFGERWRGFDLERQNAIVERLFFEEDEEQLLRVAVDEWGLLPERAEAVFTAPLPDRHYRVGRIAIGKMLPHLEKGMRYFEAASAVYGDHAKLPTGEIFDALPYYGEVLSDYTAEVPSASDPQERQHGRLANPTVHVALNQLRRLANEIIQRYGPPTEIVVELARELPLGKEDLLRREGEQRDNQNRNEAMRAEIERLLREAGATDGEIQASLGRGDAVLRMRLWKNLGKAPDTRCPYTGDQIGIRRLFSHEVHIDHILPFRRTHDNSYANKTLCLRRANEIKLDKTPWEAFHDNPAGYDWDAILLRTMNLPKNKRWRFAEDAMGNLGRMNREGVPRELASQFTSHDDFLARHLIDTQYVARLTRQYLTAVCDPRRVWPITGGNTALLRGKWNLSALLPGHNVAGPDASTPVRKSRLDHRHHAIDAFVVACTSRSMLQRIASAADDRRDRLIEHMPEPWNQFREELRDRLGRIVVSFRADHGSTGIDPTTGRARTTGALHKAGAYFPLTEPDRHGVSQVVSRKPIALFETMEEIDAIPDSVLRGAVKAFVENRIAGGAKIEDACAAFTSETGIRKVRVAENLKVIRIHDRNGRVYKAYKGDSNDYMEIWRLPDGNWAGQIVSTFDANSKRSGPRMRPHPAAKLLMRLCNDDMVRLVDDAGAERTMRIVKMSKQTIVMADHNESGNLKGRDADKDDPFKYFSKSAPSLRMLNFRKLRVTSAGHVNDPGPLR